MPTKCGDEGYLGVVLLYQIRFYSGNGVHGVHGGAAGILSKEGESKTSNPRSDPFLTIPNGDGDATFEEVYCCMCCPKN